jgi:hypothetical protein
MGPNPSPNLGIRPFVGNPMIGFPDSFMVAVTRRGHALCLGNRSTVDSPASQKSLSRLTKATAAHQAARKHADKFLIRVVILFGLIILAMSWLVWHR